MPNRFMTSLQEGKRIMADTMPSYIGRSVTRREDNRLIRGEGSFVGDIKLEGMLHVAQ